MANPACVGYLNSHHKEACNLVCKDLQTVDSPADKKKFADEIKYYIFIDTVGKVLNTTDVNFGRRSN